jgi:hypothetical protein
VVWGLSLDCGKAVDGMPPTALRVVTWSPRFHMSTCTDVHDSSQLLADEGRRASLHQVRNSYSHWYHDRRSQPEVQHWRCPLQTRRCLCGQSARRLPPSRSASRTPACKGICVHDAVHMMERTQSCTSSKLSSRAVANDHLPAAFRLHTLSCARSGWRSRLQTYSSGASVCVTRMDS